MRYRSRLEFFRNYWCYSLSIFFALNRGLLSKFKRLISVSYMLQRRVKLKINLSGFLYIKI